MSRKPKGVTNHKGVDGCYYPASHWAELQRFITGEERDPKGLFRLSDDVWDAWPYAINGRPIEAAKYRYHFQNLASFLKPYVKWVCYQRLIGSGNGLRQGAISLPYDLRRADEYLIQNKYKCIDDIASTVAFTRLWDSLLEPLKEGEQIRSRSAVRLQEKTRGFWVQLSMHFGVPKVVPPIAPHKYTRPTEFAIDESHVIPTAVIRQLSNKLALHRKGKKLLNQYHHLRLCVLMLVISLGRRIDEILSAPRGTGPDGGLMAHPARNDSLEGALWFQFQPNKDGPSAFVYVSKEWEDVVTYCVREIIRYSDEVRHLAKPEERELLILVSTSNWTKGTHMGSVPVITGVQDSRGDGANLNLPTRALPARQRTTGLSYTAFYDWLNHCGHNHKLGIFCIWKITTGGKAGGPIYKMRTHNGRHTRQTALANDPKIPLLARQRDLNVADRDVQFAYQHNRKKQFKDLLRKAEEGVLVGKGLEWLWQLLDERLEESRRLFKGNESDCEEDADWNTLIKCSPVLQQIKRVFGGCCLLPEGPEFCKEYLRCTEARDGGCPWFVTDPTDKQMIVDLDKRAKAHRRREGRSQASGQRVRANQSRIFAERTEHILIEARQVRDRLKKRLRAIKRDDQ